jgi:hypothetical protein
LFDSAAAFGRLIAPSAPALMKAMVPPTMPSSAPAARRAVEKARNERMELSNSIFGNIDDHLLVLRGSGNWV